VYLHGTPAVNLFSQVRRAFSHGCVRVSDPMALLSHVLRDDPQWTPERVDAALAKPGMTRITLRKPIRVYLLYATSLATEKGETLFFPDIYQHDKRLDALLKSRRTASKLSP
jgi:murein L,D-transpeptidase YcbB/YkuD